MSVSFKDIIDEIEMAIEMSVDDFIIQKEYNEFIDLLRYFVELQEPRIDLVNVIKKERFLSDPGSGEEK